ncbi:MULTISPECIES: hypothetical protein [unclassified Kitasatospora]|uniref:hypothetical protein n=1 Tax=unclassified Kitasatospora TaxID=2633591 RepID=UPI00247488B3|nr:hypothetical protein [Kitasatospora sp. GAS204B]
MTFADVQPELDRLEARMAALRIALRTARTSPHWPDWLVDLRAASARWDDLIDDVLAGL